MSRVLVTHFKCKILSAIISKQCCINRQSQKGPQYGPCAECEQGDGIATELNVKVLKRKKRCPVCSKKLTTKNIYKGLCRSCYQKKYKAENSAIDL